MAEEHDPEAGMKTFGGFLLFFGLGSCVLYFLDLEFVLLMWIDLWGDLVAWSIRIGLLVTGIVILAVAQEKSNARSNKPQTDAASEEWSSCESCGQSLMPGQTKCFKCGIHTTNHEKTS
jgi:hypothetical protein